VEEEAQRRAAEEEARQRVEEEAHVKAEQEAREAEAARIRAAEEARLRVEEEAQRRAAEEEARQRVEEEARERAAREARVQVEIEARARAEEQARIRAEEEERQKVEQEARLRAEAEARSAEAARVRAEEEARRVEGEARRRAEEEALGREERSRVSQGQSPVVHDRANDDQSRGIDVVPGVAAPAGEAGISAELLKKLESSSSAERSAALTDLAQIGGEDAFRFISRAFEDQSADVRNVAARALYDLQTDRAASFTRALREGSADRKRKIGEALAASGLATDAIANLTGESREKTYDAFSLLFLMAKAGEVQPLMKAIEDYPNLEVRLAVVKLLALSGQPEIVPAFRRLAVRGSLPSEVRSAVMEAIYQISSQTRETTPSAA
jgi:hypothetical protein